MVASRKIPVPDANILIDGTPIEQVTSMVYLGHMVTDDRKSDKEIKRRSEIAGNAYRNLFTILSSRDTSGKVSGKGRKYTPQLESLLFP